MAYTIVLIISIVIIFVVIAISALTTSKAYSYQHTIDPTPTDDSSKQDEGKKIKGAHLGRPLHLAKYCTKVFF
ncbi:YtzI protein [Bacillus coahuilensis]|uniref:YtzI protein n=1 Tax=Bacillus coahuilensis TaxID=408580 RepID=UPI00018508CE|nr:YtzI protein [Bacillus coahuilensis]